MYQILLGELTFFVDLIDSSCSKINDFVQRRSFKEISTSYLSNTALGSSSSLGSVLFFSDFWCNKYKRLLLIWFNKKKNCSDWRQKLGEKWPMPTTFFLTTTASITGSTIYLPLLLRKKFSWKSLPILLFYVQPRQCGTGHPSAP